MLPDAAVQHYARQQRMTAAAVIAARRAWSGMGQDFDASWRRVGPRLFAVVASMQQAAARDGAAYVGQVVGELNLDAPPEGRVSSAALAGVASDGRPLDSLLHEAVVASKAAVGSGAAPQAALAAGGSLLGLIVSTQIPDAARAAVSVGIASRPRITGYVRMLNPPSCSRCAVLAGKWFRWNQGFQRHPRCDCRHIPANEDMAGDLRTDPDAYFKSLSRSEQDRIFTKDGAESIRLGADIGQVVNARRGALGLTPAGARITADEAKALRGGLERGHLQKVKLHGQNVYITTEGTTSRGIAGKRLGAADSGVKRGTDRYRRTQTARLMPESIMQIATDRADAIQLLKRYGYLI